MISIPAIVMERPLTTGGGTKKLGKIYPAYLAIPLKRKWNLATPHKKVLKFSDFIFTKVTFFMIITENVWNPPKSFIQERCLPDQSVR